MQNAAKVLILTLAAAAIAACNKQPAQNQADQDIAIQDNLGQSTGQIPANAEIETLPQDESSATPSNQLQTGYDNPDVNDLGNSH
jgi:uncharacterized lipoprotein